MEKALVTPWQMPEAEEADRDPRAAAAQRKGTAAQQAADQASEKSTRPFPPEYHVG